MTEPSGINSVPTPAYEWVNNVDQWPVPPYELIYLVVGPSNPKDFVKGGKEIANRCIIDALARNGLSMANFGTMLDFGCGCGRIIRHWKPLSSAQLHGTDYNPKLVEWCRDNLSFAQFEVNQLIPPLKYPDKMFDFIFAGSVFTHLTEELQFAWLDELWRVLRSNGYLMITTHGDYFAQQLPFELFVKYNNGQHVTVNNGEVGTNMFGAYHSEKYIREIMARRFIVIDFIPKGWDKQDLILFQKG